MMTLLGFVPPPYTRLIKRHLKLLANDKRHFVTRQYATFSNTVLLAKLSPTDAQCRIGNLEQATLVSYILLPLQNADRCLFRIFFKCLEVL